jgi:hypothetical protein
MTRLEDADELESEVEDLKNDSKQRRGGKTTSQQMQKKRQAFLRLSEDIARAVWNKHLDISHNHLANMLKDELDIRYSNGVTQNFIPSQRELSDVLKAIAPECVPKRQSETDIPIDTRYYLIGLIKQSLSNKLS